MYVCWPFGFLDKYSDHLLVLKVGFFVSEHIYDSTLLSVLDAFVETPVVAFDNVATRF